MSAQKMMVNAVDPDGKWLYRVGGISALVLGIAYIITSVLTTVWVLFVGYRLYRLGQQ